MCMSCKVNESRRRGPCACDVKPAWKALKGIRGWLAGEICILVIGNTGKINVHHLSI